MNTKQKVVLVVDDDEDILKLTDKILSKAGYVVLTAHSPAEANKLLQVDPPHVIISDLNMAPEDGYSFIQSVKNQRSLQHIPIVVLSAVNEFNSVKRALALGIDDYVIKPIQSPLLLRKLRKALHNKDFVSWKAPEGKEPSITLKLEAQISELGETGYRVCGLFKLTPGQDIKLHVPELDAMGVQKCVHRPSKLMKKYLSEGTFTNDVTFVAINDSESFKIRQFINKMGN